jgi:hypothetical protein
VIVTAHRSLFTLKGFAKLTRSSARFKSARGCKY